MPLPPSLLPLLPLGTVPVGAAGGLPRFRWLAPDGAAVVLTVAGAGLACCALEVSAAAAGGALTPLPAEEPAEGLSVLVVAGTLTDALAPVLLAAWSALPEPRAALAFGACATCGGPYWDSYSVTKGADQLLPVDVVVPGCPPRPEALLEGLALLVRNRG